MTNIRFVNVCKYVLHFRYNDGPAKDEFPMFESLKLTIERTLPYWNDVIVPQVGLTPDLFA